MFCSSFWSHPSPQNGWQEFVSSLWAAPALCCHWCGQLTQPLAGMSVFQTSRCLDLIEEGMEKVSREPTSMTDIILPMQEQLKLISRPLSVAHSLRPYTYNNISEETLGRGTVDTFSSLDEAPVLVVAGLITHHFCCLSPCLISPFPERSSLHHPDQMLVLKSLL